MSQLQMTKLRLINYIIEIQYIYMVKKLPIGVEILMNTQILMAGEGNIDCSNMYQFFITIEKLELASLF